MSNFLTHSKKYDIPGHQIGKNIKKNEPRKYSIYSVKLFLIKKSCANQCFAS